MISERGRRRGVNKSSSAGTDGWILALRFDEICAHACPIEAHTLTALSIDPFSPVNRQDAEGPQRHSAPPAGRLAALPRAARQPPLPSTTTTHRRRPAPAWSAGPRVECSSSTGTGTGRRLRWLRSQAAWDRPAVQNLGPGGLWQPPSGNYESFESISLLLLLLALASTRGQLQPTPACM